MRRFVARCVSAVVIAALGACDLGTEPQGPFVNLAGTWDFTGDQVAPARELVGTLIISNQSDNEITGQLSFEERDGLGGFVPIAGPVSGVVIGMTDTDFDLNLSGGTRRHIAQVSANGDTLSGAWAEPASGKTGEFKAVRAAP